MTNSLAATSRAVVVARTPDGAPVATDFAVAEVALTELAAGEVLVQVDALSLDPYLRSLLDVGHLGEPVVGIGQTLPGRGLGTVVASNSDTLAIDTLVVADVGWREHVVLPAAEAQPVTVPVGVPASAVLGVLGMPGLTAYAAHTRHLQPKVGDTVVIGSATGGVGSLAGQLARIAGARTIAIVGDPEKADLAQALGYDEVVVRTAPDWLAQLHAATPDRIDGYLHMGDQAVLDGVVEHLAVGARVSLCGLIDQSNGASPTRVRAGALMAARATTYGMVVYDHVDLSAEHVRRVGALLAAGQVLAPTEVYDGLESAGEAFAALMSGRNRGKVIVQISQEEQ